MNRIIVYFTNLPFHPIFSRSLDIQVMVVSTFCMANLRCDRMESYNTPVIEDQIGAMCMRFCIRYGNGLLRTLGQHSRCVCLLSVVHPKENFVRTNVTQRYESMSVGFKMIQFFKQQNPFASEWFFRYQSFTQRHAR